jgi:hypothetical protein
VSWLMKVGGVTRGLHSLSLLTEIKSKCGETRFESTKQICWVNVAHNKSIIMGSTIKQFLEKEVNTSDA